MYVLWTFLLNQLKGMVYTMYLYRSDWSINEQAVFWSYREKRIEAVHDCSRLLLRSCIFFKKIHSLCLDDREGRLQSTPIIPSYSLITANKDPGSILCRLYYLNFHLLRIHGEIWAYLINCKSTSCNDYQRTIEVVGLLKDFTLNKWMGVGHVRIEKCMLTPISDRIRVSRTSQQIQIHNTILYTIPIFTVIQQRKITTGLWKIYIPMGAYFKSCLIPTRVALSRPFNIPILNLIAKRYRETHVIEAFHETPSREHDKSPV